MKEEPIVEHQCSSEGHDVCQAQPRGVRSSRRPSVWAVVVAATALIVTALMGTAFAATTTVKAGAEIWKPKHAYITKGDIIRWKNPTTKLHNVKSIGSNWSFNRSLPPGEIVKRQFKAIGTFKYRCTYHSAIVDGKCEGQCGLIHVFAG